MPAVEHHILVHDTGVAEKCRCAVSCSKPATPLALTVMRHSRNVRGHILGRFRKFAPSKARLSRFLLKFRKEASWLESGIGKLKQKPTG